MFRQAHEQHIHAIVLPPLVILLLSAPAPISNITVWISPRKAAKCKLQQNSMNNRKQQSAVYRCKHTHTWSIRHLPGHSHSHQSLSPHECIPSNYQKGHYQIPHTHINNTEGCITLLTALVTICNRGVKPLGPIVSGSAPKYTPIKYSIV